MNIFNYFSEIKNKVNKFNAYITNPINYKDLNNPFRTTLPKTYVWVEGEENKKDNC